jgi:hypothetical protein
MVEILCQNTSNTYSPTWVFVCVSMISPCVVADHRCSCAPYPHHDPDTAPPLADDHSERPISRPSYLIYKQIIHNPNIRQCNYSPKTPNKLCNSTAVSTLSSLSGCLALSLLFSMYSSLLFVCLS